VINGKIYAVGGQTGCGTLTDANEVYDSITDSWATRTSCPRAEYATGGVVGGRLYLVAGNQGNFTDIYDPLADTWSSGAPMTIARTEAAAAAINGLLYVIGGNGAQGFLSSVEAYDPVSDTWSEKAPLPIALGSLTEAATALNGRIYVYGGASNSGLSSAVYVYDPASDLWSAVTSMPGARQNHGSASAAGKLFTVGGYTNAAGNYTTDVYGFTPNCAPSPTPTPPPTATFTPTPTPTATFTPTPTPTPTPTAAAVITAVGPAQVWIGLKNSDDVGTSFDLLAEALKNGTAIGSGQVNGVSGGSSGFNNAILDTINMSLPSSVTFQSGDTLSFRLSVRVAATGHRSGTARLWFNDATANSRFSATVNATTNSYFLLTGFALGST